MGHPPSVKKCELPKVRIFFSVLFTAVFPTLRPVPCIEQAPDKNLLNK